MLPLNPANLGLLAGLLPIVTLCAQTGRSMHLLSPAATGADCRFSVSYPLTAVGNPYGILWSDAYPGSHAIQVPGFATSGLLRVDPAQAAIAFAGIFDGTGVATNTIPVPNGAQLLGLAIDLQSIDLDPLTPGLALADDDLPLVVGGLRQDWEAIYAHPIGGHDYLKAVTTDAGGVFVTGSSLGYRPWNPFNPYSYEIVTQRWSHGGVLQWERRYDSPGTGFDDVGIDIQLAANGDVVVLGQGPGASGDQDVVLSRHDSTGVPLWTTSWNHTWSDGAIDLGIAGDGSIYVLASAYNPATVGDITLLKYSPAGVLQWERFFDSNTGTDVGVGLAFDSHGNVDIGGYGIGPSGGTNFDWLAVEFDPSGNLLWSQRLAGSPTLPDYCWGMTVDALDRVLLTGSLASTPGGYAVAAFADGGGWLWTSLLGTGGGAPYCEVRGDAAGNLYCASMSSVVAIGASGAVQWQRTVLGSVRALELDAGGRVMVTASVTVPGSNEQFVLAAFDAQGNSLGQQVFGGPRVDSFAPRGLTASGGVIHAVGSTRNAANSNDGYLTRWTLLP